MVLLAEISAASLIRPFSGEKWIEFSRRLARAARSRFSSPWMLSSAGMAIFRGMFLGAKRCL